MERAELVALVPHRLCATKRGKFPESKMLPLVKLAVDWQRSGVRADFWGMGATSDDDSGERMYEIGGIMAAIGEQLGLACLVHHEVANWKALQPRKGDRQVAREMSSRALIELQAHFVLAIGHAFANLAGRVVAMDGSLRGELRKALRTDFPPYSTDRKDWIQLGRIPKLQLIAASCSSSDMKAVVAPAAHLAKSSAWTALEESRGQDFHQWRPQTAGLRGAASGAFGRSLSNGERSYSFSGGQLLGSDVTTKLAADAWSVTNNGMWEVRTAMQAFENAFRIPIERLTSLIWN